MHLSFEEASYDLHGGLTARFRVDPKIEPFLRDHVIDGTPVLPGVVGLEAFAEVASLLAPDDRVAALEDVRFLAPMKYYRNEPRAAIVRALPVLSDDGKVRVRTSLSSVQTLVGREAEEKLHFTAVVVLERGGAGAGRQAAVEPARVAGNIDGEAIYQVYFHGPAYRVLDKVERTGPDRLTGTFASALPADTADSERKSVVGPRLVELCFQTAGVWEIGQTGQLGLPAAVDRVVLHGREANGGPLVADVRPRNGNGEGLCFDGRVRDGAGRVYVEVEGYRTARLPGTLPEADLAPFKGVVGA
jgi:hypothetical protein